MSSSNNPWNPNSVYRDCSQEICSIYCPQWCSIIYPPPPPFFTLGNNDDDSYSAFQFSPLIVALIGILASAFILITYYTIISRFCRRNNRRSQVGDPNDLPVNTELPQNTSPSGLDEALIKSITVFKYIKGEGLIEGTDCSVCLSEFQENESLRLMPKCNHAFHLPCIDTWLKSNSSCPLCRSDVFSVADNSSQNPRNPPMQQEQASSARINISAMEFRQRNDSVVVIENSERSCHQEIVVNFGRDIDSCTKPTTGVSENGLGSDIRISERSSSLNSCTNQGRNSVADVLNVSEDDEEIQRGVLLEVGSSRGIEENGKSDMMKNMNSFNGVKRSDSTGRFMFSRNTKEKDSVLPK